ncbi:UNVERIFIED_CONTAM: putative histone H2AXb [Sesamum radiatum]|uniref:Histone H2A n=1 Tax=Sesamum radiatum TaxID=300843 RepID=A0AAW2W6Q9_SESRA
MSSAASPSRKGRKGKSKAAKSVSRSTKAGLEFPVGRIDRFLKEGKYAQRVNASAPAYLAAVLEYLADEAMFCVGACWGSGKAEQEEPDFTKAYTTGSAK